MFEEDYAIKPPEELNVDESNLCVLIHDNPKMNKYELFVLSYEMYEWPREKFNQLFESLIAKGAITQEGY